MIKSTHSHKTYIRELGSSVTEVLIISDHILVDGRHVSRTMDVRSCTAAYCETQITIQFELYIYRKC
jgi:hypothetical protein